MNPRGNPKHGHHGTLTYARWKSMMQRCYAPKTKNFAHYGSKGIDVCRRWHDFALFLADMGECPSRSMTLDRKDAAKGYEPANCRWATRAEQNRNRPSHAVMLTHEGQTHSATDWANSIGMTPNALLMRLRLGWSVARALTQPVKARAVVSRRK